MKSIGFILGNIVKEAVKSDDLIDYRNASALSRFIKSYAKENNINLDYLVKQEGLLYCEKEEWHDWWKRGGKEKYCSNCGKVEIT